MDDKSGTKIFKYRQQLTNIAHREEVSFNIELDDILEFDDELAEAVQYNTRRYTTIVSEVCN